MMKASENNNKSSSSDDDQHRPSSLLESLAIPTLLLNSDICRDNIARMVKSARQHHVQLRPHFKTHQSRAIGNYFQQEFGITCATVSSLQMARYFATDVTSSNLNKEEGCSIAPCWRDLTVAFPFNMHEIDTVNELLQLPNMRLGLTIENQPSLNVLFEKVHYTYSSGKTATDSVTTTDTSSHSSAAECSSVLRLWIKVDAGYHRTGIPIHDIDEIRGILRLIVKQQQQQQQQQRQQEQQQQEKTVVALEIAGILLHSGHSYNVHRDNFVDDIDQIHQDTLQKVSALHQELCQEFPALEYSIGDTPCCSRIAFESQSTAAVTTTTSAYCNGNNDKQILTEIRPGNFVFYDVMQYYIGSIPSLDHVAVCMACPVVAKHVERQEIVVYGGAVHLSKDSVTIQQIQPAAGISHDMEDDKNTENKTTHSRKAVSCWGLVVSLDPVKGTWNNDNVWENAYVSKLSQEHGIIYTACMEQFEQVNIGDWIGILPIHSCLTADIMGEYLDIQTRQRIDSMRSRK